MGRHLDATTRMLLEKYIQRGDLSRKQIAMRLQIDHQTVLNAMRKAGKVIQREGAAQGLAVLYEKMQGHNSDWLNCVKRFNQRIHVKACLELGDKCKRREKCPAFLEYQKRISTGQ